MLLVRHHLRNRAVQLLQLCELFGVRVIEDLPRLLGCVQDCVSLHVKDVLQM